MSVNVFTMLLRHAFIVALFACFAHCDREKYMFSGKTMYQFVNKTIPRPMQLEPVYISMVIRHGSRYPSKSRVKSFSRILETINAFFPTNKTDNTTFRYKGLTLPWQIPDDVKNRANKELSRLGEQEMFWIGKHIHAQFPELFKNGYSNNNYSFIATDKLRSSQSAVAFAQGIFEHEGTVGKGKYQPIAVKFSGPADSDRVLRIYEACPKWKKVNAKSQNSEYAKFIRGPQVQNVIENIYGRLKLKGKIRLTPRIIVEIFLMCAFGMQTDSNDISLCSLFEYEDLKALEYLLDLKMYWSYSYGRKLNYRMACLLYIKIADGFRQFIRSGKPHGVFQFAHTGTVLPLLTLLGLYKDDKPLRADNFDEQANRTFRPSHIAPMSANIAFVLYERTRNHLSRNYTTHSRKEELQPKHSMSAMVIQVLVNEVAVNIPACRGKTYCRLKKFLNYYSHIKKSCNINRICGRIRKKCRRETS